MENSTIFRMFHDYTFSPQLFEAQTTNGKRGNTHGERGRETETGKERESDKENHDIVKHIEVHTKHNTQRQVIQCQSATVTHHHRKTFLVHTSIQFSMEKSIVVLRQVDGGNGAAVCFVCEHDMHVCM